MVQVKLFVSIESEVGTLESEMNAWLKDHGKTKILNIFGNIAPQTVSTEQTQLSAAGRRFAPSDLFLTIVYDDDA